MNDNFGHWLAGFIDGEGCFVARITKGGQIQTFMTVALRSDDADILHECQKRTGLGKVYERYPPSHQAKKSWRPQTKWEIFNKKDSQGLVSLLRQYPLRAKKVRDFETWSRIVDLHAAFQVGDDKQDIIALIDKLRSDRIY